MSTGCLYKHDTKSSFSEQQIVFTKTQQGNVKGLKREGIYSFKGIPYADTLEGLNKWLPPKPPQPFEDIYDGTNFGQICPQDIMKIPRWMTSKSGEAYMEGSDMYGLSKQEQGDNCLNLNIWTASLNKKEKLPVIAFIHGGGLAMGSSQNPIYNGHNIAKKEVVFVTLNYRVGMLGFLAGDGLFKGEILKGNRGFMDQAAALKWIKNNIENFGGDPDNITVAGQSGGGSSVWALLASPRSEGLFQRAIVQSGPITFIPLHDQLKVTKEVLKKLGITPGDSKALAALPNNKLSNEIIYNTISDSKSDYGKMSQTKFPSAGTYGTEFLPDDIFQALEKGRSKEIDLMVGSNLHDGRAFALIMPLPDAWAISIINGMIGGMIAEDRQKRKEIFRKYKKLMKSDSSYYINEKIQTDALYKMRSLHAAEIHSTFKKAGTYVYQFNWQSPVNNKKMGAIHGLEIPFAFDNLERSREMIGDVAKAQPLADAMSDAWVSFAKNGTPNSKLLPKWPKYDKKSRKTMFFNTNSTIVSNPDDSFRKLWKF